MIETYEEFKERYKDAEYSGIKCFLCDKPAEYKCGDERFYFPGCEDHAEMKEKYDEYTAKIKLRRKAHEAWINLLAVKEKIVDGTESEGTDDVE